jgi:hypothetical protein
MKPIEAGEICVIIKETEAFRENVGAFVTVVEYVESTGGWMWTFKDASRPILVGINLLLHKFYVSSSQECIDRWGPEPGFNSGCLIPIRDPGPEVEERIELDQPAFA